MAPARRHLEAAIEGVDPELTAEYRLAYGTDPAVLCGTRPAILLWLQGHRARALRARDEALVRAERLDHPYNTVTARCFAAWLALELGDVERLRLDLALIDSRDGPQAEMWREVRCAYLERPRGQVLGVTRAERAMAAAATAPALGFEVLIGRLAVAVHEAARDVRGGLKAAEWALGRSGQHRVFEAEFRRVRAVCVRALGRDEEAEAELERAPVLARR